MGTNINAILIHEDDNVVTVTTAINKGDTVEYQKDENTVELTVKEDIPVFHKVAVAEIEKNAPVYKYGQLIGKAIDDIYQGCHVHDHNIESPPGSP